MTTRNTFWVRIIAVEIVKTKNNDRSDIKFSMALKGVLKTTAKLLNDDAKLFFPPPVQFLD